MSATPRAVSWALEIKCPLRSPGDWEKPEAPAFALGDLQDCVRAERQPRSRHGIFDGVYVTGAFTNARFPYPQRGYAIEARFSRQGGLARVKQLCGDCPANSEVGEVAGCTGWFSRRFDLESNERLTRIVKRLGLQEGITEHF